MNAVRSAQAARFVASRPVADDTFAIHATLIHSWTLRICRALAIFTSDEFSGDELLDKKSCPFARARTVIASLALSMVLSG